MYVSLHSVTLKQLLVTFVTFIITTFVIHGKQIAHDLQHVKPDKQFTMFTRGQFTMFTRGHLPSSLEGSSPCSLESSSLCSLEGNSSYSLESSLPYSLHGSSPCSIEGSSPYSLEGSSPCSQFNVLIGDSYLFPFCINSLPFFFNMKSEILQ